MGNISKFSHKILCWPKCGRPKLSHNIIVPSKSVLDVNDVIHNLISHISSGACLGSLSPSCTILNSSFCGEEPDDNNADLRLTHRLSSDLKIDILSRIIHKLKLRPLRRILLQNSVYHDRNGSLSYLRLGRELKKYITRLKQGKCTEERRSKELKLENNQKRNQQLVKTWPQLVNQNLNEHVILRNKSS